MGGAAGGGGSLGGAAGKSSKDGGTTDGANLDLSGITPPAMLTVSIKDRRATLFELVWTAPLVNGQPATGYQVRYAKVPITAANFDDTTVTTAVPYSSTPAQPGNTDGTTVKLYIENSYYFAIQGTNSTGGGTIDGTTTAAVAHFNETSLAGMGPTSELFGSVLDGSADLNGDALSDVLVGSTAGQHAYIFFGTRGNFAPTTPSVVFAGDSTTTAFGRGLGVIGDIDGDGKDDIAISDFSGTPPRMFIYKGRSSWPMTPLGPSDADYVITADTTYNESAFGISIARLGDFNGDGKDDFAFAAQQYKNGTNNVGRVVIVLGKQGFANITLPDTTNTITIDGDSTLTNPIFGARVLGLGRFYSVTSGSTLIVSSPGLASSANSSQGRLYAFHGQPGSAGAIALSSADNMVLGPTAGSDIGNVLTNLGPMFGTANAVASGNPADTTSSTGVSGSAFLFKGDMNGPFGTPVILERVGATKSGQVIIGGGISGVDASYSLVGDSKPDLVFIPQTTTSIQIVDGNAIAALPAAIIDPTNQAPVTVPEPPGWGSTGPQEGTLIPDLNGDGYPDFAIANALSGNAGAVAVYW